MDPQVWASISITTPGPGRTPRIGGFTPVEGDRWTMLVSGYADDRPSRDPDDHRRRCEQDFPPEFGKVAATAEWLSDVATYHQADSRRRDFTAEGLPAGLVAAGDAVASFNPVYGQGMTSAMLHASCLSRYLRGGPGCGGEPAGQPGHHDARAPGIAEPPGHPAPHPARRCPRGRAGA